MGSLPTRVFARYLVTIAVAIVPAICLVAAVGKLLDWSTFEASLKSFALVSQTARTSALVFIPPAEVAIFTLLMCGRPVASNLAATALLLLFLIVIAWHWAENEKPTCACLGLWTRYVQVEQSTVGMLIRNSILIFLSGGAAALAFMMRVPDASRRRGSPS